MKNLSILILILSLISCNSDKKTTELKAESEKLNSELIGFYEHRTSEKSENHYIIIDTLNGEYNGSYFGTEDSGGHGVFFYGNDMENLLFKNKKVSFEIGTRNLYETTRMRIVKHKDDIGKDSTIGISRGFLKYNGKVTSTGILLSCESEYGECWENEMSFEKVTEQK